MAEQAGWEKCNVHPWYSIQSKKQHLFKKEHIEETTTKTNVQAAQDLLKNSDLHTYKTIYRHYINCENWISIFTTLDYT